MPRGVRRTQEQILQDALTAEQMSRLFPPRPHGGGKKTYEPDPKPEKKPKKGKKS